MSSGHTHSHAISAPGSARHERALWMALGMTGAFLVAEVIGGMLTGSLALISDAAHMFTDSAALAISLAAIRIGRRGVDDRRTFGYYRFEIIAAAFNALLLFGVAIYILYEAYERAKAPTPIASGGMLAIAILGLAVNLVSMRLLQSGKDQSLNVKGAYLEVWSDMLGSVGVIVGAIVIWLTGWTWVDSGIAVLIGLWVLPRTWILLRDSINILLEGVPAEMDLAEVRTVLSGLAKVDSVHELHLWAMTSGKASLSVHLVSAHGDADAITQAAAKALQERFDLHHSTIQVEKVSCAQADGEHRF
ncbi:cation diffusion facilitator family transporter [Variovorax sp. OV329]|uniref:cation diffusion facilitator family transporter n=1 Tax=Variovorax sp. OV329 TaxID=1882825 RepID=UPI0008E25D09|nr:cation diffusion facilitator family transporter [Variovorax sp. OV329]SFN01911.1 cobalt-zinc-cadmium efflux system protein [Variovorax sp. OV329]